MLRPDPPAPFAAHAVVVAVPGLAAHWLSPFGNAWLTLRTLEGLAPRSILGDRVFAVDPSRDAFLGDTLALACEAHGSRVALFRPERYPADIDRHFAANAIYLTEPGTSGEEFSEIILGLLDAQEAPSTVWVVYDELLPPWPTVDPETFADFADRLRELNDDRADPPRALPWLIRPLPDSLADHDTWRAVVATYAAAVVAFDDWLGEFTETLESTDLGKATTLLVVGTHGLPLGEELSRGTRVSLHEESTHVPALIRCPGDWQGGRRLDAMLSPDELVHGLLAAQHRPDSPDAERFHRLLRGEPVTPGHLLARHGQARSIRLDDWLLIQDSPEAAPRLFAKPSDRFEANDLARIHSEWSDYLMGLLASAPEGRSLPEEPRPYDEVVTPFATQESPP